MTSPENSPAFEMRIHRNQPRTIYMHSPAYPAGEAVATCSLTWVAEAFVKLWNENREAHLLDEAWKKDHE